MWRWVTKGGEDKDTILATIHSAAGLVDVSNVIKGWRNSPTFRDFWVESLRAIPFDAYYWEMPPLILRNLDQLFECAFVQNHGLASLKPDRVTFGERFNADNSANGYATFPTLGHDAMLVAPYPVAPDEVYTHLAVFMRKASAAQIHQVWSGVAEAVEAALGAEPIWVNTAGMGVSWLHIRIDSRPKYYHYQR